MPMLSSSSKNVALFGLLALLVINNCLELVNSSKQHVDQPTATRAHRVHATAADEVEGQDQDEEGHVQLTTPSRNIRDYVLQAIPAHDTKLIRELTDYAVDYCHVIGNVGMWKYPPEPTDLAVIPPISLLPSPFPKELFEKAERLQPLLNELYFRVTMDHDFIVDAYKHLMEADPWIKRQVELMIRVKEAGIKQHKTLIVERADYLTHLTDESDQIEIKQVEVNISQLGGPGTGTNMSNLHVKMLEKVENLHYGKLPVLKGSVVPVSRSSQSLAQAMLLAREEHVKQYGDERAVIVFITDPKYIANAHFEQVQFMQYEVEALARKSGKYVNVERVTILESAERLRLDESDHHSLYLDGNKRVALVHMVLGLLPHHWPTDREWNARFDMERSNAILSPNIRAQLTGTKRMQQVLAGEGVLEHFLADHHSAEEIAELRSTFVGLWGLEKHNPETEAIIQEAIAKPQNFVLKAQLGAGKGNHFNSEVKQMLESMDANERGAYTLMEKIQPISVKNYMRRQFRETTLEDVNTEISIFGSLLGDGTAQESKVIFNRVEGNFVRSKVANSDQGGISEGFGLIDTVVLFPAEEFAAEN